MKLLKFEKDGCNPCKMVSEYLDMCGATYERINPFNDPERAGDFGIMSVPVVVLLDENGNELKRSIGYNEDELESILDLIG